MPKEIDDFSVCGENWFSLTQVEEILGHLHLLLLWCEAGGNADQDIREVRTLAHAAVIELRRHLINLQIELLKIL